MCDEEVCCVMVHSSVLNQSRVFDGTRYHYVMLSNDFEPALLKGLVINHLKFRPLFSMLFIFRVEKDIILPQP